MFYLQTMASIQRVVRLVGFVLMMLQILLLETNAQVQGDSGQNEQAVESSLFFYHQSEYPRDCQEVHDQCSSTISDGVYIIKPDGLQDSFEVYCDSTSDSGGWTVIKKRHIEGTVDFKRDWENYKFGFGYLSHDYWIGNERLSYLTNQKEYELLIEVTTSDGLTFNQSYSNFRIGDEFSSYKLLGAYLRPGLIDQITWCPNNMVYGNCSCGQRQCGDPAICHDTCDNNLTEGCICPKGYYMQGDDCVPAQQCDCYLLGTEKLLTNNEAYVNNMCTVSIVCTNGILVRNNGYECSPNAVCAERDGVRKCYCNEGYTGDGETCIYNAVHTDCQDVYNAGNTADGVYLIRPTNWHDDPFEVYCNMTSNGQGWTVFQRRVNGSVDFDRDWDDYAQGFGSADHEHLLGNDKLHFLTAQRNYELRIDMVFKDGNPYHGIYTPFAINDGDDKYRISSLGTYSGTAPHGSYRGLTWNLNRRFTTRDQNNDDLTRDNCALTSCSGGWWYGHCTWANMNGLYSTGDNSYDSILWSNYYYYHNLKYTEMKIRPV